jgi:hypothetical protein
MPRGTKFPDLDHNIHTGCPSGNRGCVVFAILRVNRTKASTARVPIDGGQAASDAGNSSTKTPCDASPSLSCGAHGMDCLGTPKDALWLSIRTVRRPGKPPNVTSSLGGLISQADINMPHPYWVLLVNWSGPAIRNLSVDTQTEKSVWKTRSRECERHG